MHIHTSNRYNVTVNAFNHVSSDARSVITVVKEWYCYQPNITFAENLTNTANPLQFMKSVDFFIRPTSVAIDCMKSYNQSSTVWQIRGGDSQPDMDALHHPSRYLPYGEYTIDFTVELVGVEDEYYDMETIYIEIIPTPLYVSINGKCNGECISNWFSISLF